MSQPALSTTPSPVEMSLDDWWALPEDEPGELVAGYLEEEEMPEFIHEILVSWLVHFFHGHFSPRGGFVVGSETKLAVAPDRGRKPDLAVYLPGRPRPSARGPIDVPPDIVVEVVSPSPSDGRRDRVEKVAEYAAFGIRFYWIVDPQLRSLEVLQLGSEGFYLHALGVSSGVVEVPGCEGLRLDVDALWAEIDRVEAES